ncbi:hypothetical protein [Nocardioides nanhaiensis]|uniref:DUF3168 domain-containing protein n=1 Tax=Nocardioides nanhaiensis TaxID=1476871 RepID=A0ABP8X1L7_9ACTN
MSAAVRELFANAASSVEGITGFPYYTQTTRPGHAYVRLDRVEYPNAFGGMAYWQVIVIAPQSIDGMERFIEKNSKPLHEALSEHMTIQTMSPQQISLPNDSKSSYFALIISGYREEE